MTKNRAIEAGIELFLQKGYSNVGLAEILKTAEIPKGSFYHHFKSKEAFAIQVLDAYSYKGLQHFKEILLEEKELSPKERMLKFYKEMIYGFEANEFTKGCLLGDSCFEAAVGEGYTNFVEQQLNNWQSVVEKCLLEAKEIGELDDKADTRLLSSIIQNGWEGAIARMKSMKSRQPLEDFVASLDLLLPTP